MSRLLFGICLLVATLIACNGIEQQEEVISFNTHIRPILSDKCFKCHGPDEKKRISGYRLDTEEGAYALLKDQKNKYGIVAGHPETSDVYRRITSTDPEYMMPPPEENLALTKEEIALIGKWISQGARYEKHWSFIPLAPVPVPNVDEPKVVNEIDHFVLTTLQRHDLELSPEEGKEKLLRRVLHDITGLPPTLAEQQAFQADKSENAYEKVVDAALASPHYGEKMAILWMDIARYADSIIKNLSPGNSPATCFPTKTRKLSSPPASIETIKLRRRVASLMKNTEWNMSLTEPTHLAKVSSP